MRQTVERLRRSLRTIRIVQRTYSKFVEQPLHLFYPRRFTEKMQWRKLFDLDPIYAVFCDKVATREYVAQRVGSDALVPMLWLGRDPAVREPPRRPAQNSCSAWQASASPQLLLRSRSLRIWTSPFADRVGARLRRGGTIADSGEGGRPGQDQSP